jgi:hypothetical protein
LTNSRRETPWPGRRWDSAMGGPPFWNSKAGLDSGRCTTDVQPKPAPWPSQTDSPSTVPRSSLPKRPEGRASRSRMFIASAGPPSGNRRPLIIPRSRGVHQSKGRLVDRVHAGQPGAGGDRGQLRDRQEAFDDPNLGHRRRHVHSKLLHLVEHGGEVGG